MTDMQDYMADMGFNFEADVAQPLRPWMQAHKFVLVKSLRQLQELVDNCLEAGSCALDLETEGFDNRVYFNDQGRPYTHKRIVGYCLCYDGVTGYYVPVGHLPKDSGNLDYDLAAREIARLCLAAQPLAPANSKSPLADKNAIPGKVKIFFWNAKFDHEWLYPITGIRYWHPDSFEDGCLLAFCVHSDREVGLKEIAYQEYHVAVFDYDTKQLQKSVSEDFVFTVEPTRSAYDPKKKKVMVPYDMMELKELFGGKTKDIAFAKLHPEEGTIYGASDSICTYIICKSKKMWDEWAKVKSTIPGHPDTYRLEKQVAEVMREMERNRFKIDMAKAHQLTLDAQRESDELKQKIETLAADVKFPSFDIRSSSQLGSLLFDPQYLNIEPKPEKNEKSDQWKTGADVLEALYKETGNEILQDILKFRQVDKVQGTYLKNLEIATKTCKDGTLRANFNQTGAATGRFTAPSGSPHDGCGVPVHGIPSTASDDKSNVAVALRYCFVGDDDEVVVKIDFAGQELRGVTNICLEPVWLNEFLHGTGDLHTITAQAFFNKEQVTPAERKQGKICNFGLIYGGGPSVIVRATKCTKEEGIRRKQAFDAKVPKFATWVKSQHAKVRKTLGVRNAFGRWLAIPDAHSEDPKIRAACERKSINYPIQSAGADMMKICLVALYHEFYRRNWLDKVRMRLTVHDEIVFTVKKHLLMEAIPVIQKIMESPGRMAVNEDGSKWVVEMKVEILVDKTWAAKNDWTGMVEGHSYKPGSKVGTHQYVVSIPLPDGNGVQDRVYDRIPEWLGEWIKPNHNQPIPQDQGAVKAAVDPSPLKPVDSKPAKKVAVFEITTLNRISAKEFANFLQLSRDPNGVHFKLVYRDTQAVIVDGSVLGYPTVNEATLRDLLANSLLLHSPGVGCCMPTPNQPLLQDFTQECNNQGVPEHDFRLAFCDRCQNHACQKSLPNRADKYTNRVLNWEKRLFLEVPRKSPTEDPSVATIAAQKFGEVNLTRWADPHSSPKTLVQVPSNFELAPVVNAVRPSLDFARKNTPNPGPVTLPGEKTNVVKPGATFQFED